jgi:hypothetical protein
MLARSADVAESPGRTSSGPQTPLEYFTFIYNIQNRDRLTACYPYRTAIAVANTGSMGFGPRSRRLPQYRGIRLKTRNPKPYGTVVTVGITDFKTVAGGTSPVTPRGMANSVTRARATSLRGSFLRPPYARFPADSNPSVLPVVLRREIPGSRPGA